MPRVLEDAAETSVSVGLEVDGASGNPELEIEVAEVMQECFQLWKSRQRKYGTGNIAMFGEQGCVVRAADKLARLRESLFVGKEEANDETVEDTWMDLLNYAAMGLLCHRGKWPL